MAIQKSDAGVLAAGKCQEPSPSRGDAVRVEALETSAAPDHEALEPGDLVRLGRRAPVEHRERTGVVTRVGQAHCTVVVLDPTCRFGCGESWPFFADVELTCTSFRVGSRVVIQGMQGEKASHMNGLSGQIDVHPREGHPCFLTRPASPDPLLVVCVRLDAPVPGGRKVVMLEPRYLGRPGECVKKASRELSDLVRSMARAEVEDTEEAATITEGRLGEPASKAEEAQRAPASTERRLGEPASKVEQAQEAPTITEARLDEPSVHPARRRACRTNVGRCTKLWAGRLHRDIRNLAVLLVVASLALFHAWHLAGTQNTHSGESTGGLSKTSF